MSKTGNKDKQQQSSVLSVFIKDNENRQFRSTTLLTPKKPSIMNSSSKSLSQSEYKQLNLNKKDLFRNKTLNNISSTPSNSKHYENKNFQSPFASSGNNNCNNRNSISNANSNCNSGNRHSNSHSKNNAIATTTIMPNSVKNSAMKQINFTTTASSTVSTLASLGEKKQRPPLFVIQEKKLTEPNPNPNETAVVKEERCSILMHGTPNNNNERKIAANSSSISSSSKVIQMNKMTLKDNKHYDTHTYQRSNNNINNNNNRINNNRRNQNHNTVHTTTLHSCFKPQKDTSHCQIKTNSHSLKKKKIIQKPAVTNDTTQRHNHQQQQHLQYRNKKLDSTLNNSIKKGSTCISNSLLLKEKNNSHNKNKNDNTTTTHHYNHHFINKNNNNSNNKNKNTNYIQSNSINKKNYLSLNGSSDNFSFANSNKSKLKSASINFLQQNIPIIHFYTSEFVLSCYAKVLTQKEVDELLSFDDSIYFIGKLPFRKAEKLYEKNDLLKSFRQVNCDDCYNDDIKSLINYSPCKSMHHLHYNNNPIEQDESYDDEESDYNLIIGDHIYYRYEIIKLLGKGSFGEAIKCFDHKTNELVCLKLIKSDQRFQSQALIEIKLLEHIKSHDKDNESNIVKYYSNFIFRNHKCIVFELLDMNLYEYIKVRDYNGIELKKIKSYTTELLYTLLYLKRNNIIHCDLKPENILLCRNSKINVKTIDFGSSCFDNEKMYCYIQSRFYRAPEIILDQGYGIEIDMWSLGCIIAELYTGIPIFPGEEERDQLNYMMEYLDVPSNDYINMSRKRDMFFDENNYPLRVPNSKGKIRCPRTKAFASFLQGSDDYFQDFVRKCLRWFPEERITPEEGLMHHWIIKDMSAEALYLHKLKIKRIRCGISKSEQKASTIEANRIAMKQKTINNSTCSTIAITATHKKINRSCSKKKGYMPAITTTSTKRNKEKGNWNININNISSGNTNLTTKPLSTKHSTTNGKYHVSLSLEDNNTNNNNKIHYNHTINLNHANTTQGNIDIIDLNQEKITVFDVKDDEKDKEKQGTSLSKQQKYSFIDLEEEEQ